MRVRITLEAEFVNFNPKDIYDPTPEELRGQLESVLAESSLWLDTERKAGIFQRDLFPEVESRVEVI